MDPLLYTVGECCRLLAIGRTKFYELAANGQIPIRKIGQKTVVAAADLKLWAESLPAIEKPRSEQIDAERGRGEGAPAKVHMDAPARSEASQTNSDRG